MSKIMPIAYIDLKRYFGEIGEGYFLRVTLRSIGHLCPQGQIQLLAPRVKIILNARDKILRHILD